MKLNERHPELLVEYADGELSAGEAGLVEEHLAGCAECREMVASLRKTLGLARQVWLEDEATLASFRPSGRGLVVDSSGEATSGREDGIGGRAGGCLRRIRDSFCGLLGGVPKPDQYTGDGLGALDATVTPGAASASPAKTSSPEPIAPLESSNGGACPHAAPGAFGVKGTVLRGRVRACHPTPNLPRGRLGRIRRGAIAAGLLLVLVGALVWMIGSGGSKREGGFVDTAGRDRPGLVEPYGPISGSYSSQDSSLVEISRQIERECFAERLLAGAKLLSEAPGGGEIANQRFKQILTDFPDTAAAEKTRNLIHSERKTG